MITDYQLIKLISYSDFRKHHDSAFLWIFVFISSLSLHLFVFWLIQSSIISSSSLSDSKQDTITVDFVDISTLSKSHKSGKSPIIKNTNKSIEKSITQPTQKTSSVKTLSKQHLQPNLENHNSTIISTSPIPSAAKKSTTKSEVHKNEVRQSPTTKPENSQSQNNQSLVNKQSNSQTEKTTKSKNTQSQNNNSQNNILPIKQQPYPTFTNTPQPKTTVLPQEKPWERHQDFKLGAEKPLPQDIKPEPSTTDQREDRGGAIATITPLIKDEVNELIQQKKLLVDALPDILPEYKGSETQDIDISLLPNDIIVQPASIFASLIIDKDGKFRQSVILSIEPDTLYSDKKIYENALNKIFQQSSFTSAVNKDGSKPELSNLYVRLRIDLTN